MKYGMKKLSAFLLAFCMLFNTLVIVPVTVFATDLEVEKDEDLLGTLTGTEQETKHAYEPFASIKAYQNAENRDEVDESTLMIKVSASAPAMSPIPEELAALGVSVVRVSVDATTPEAMENLGVSEPYRWLTVGFTDTKATEVGLSFMDIPYVLDAEYNYIRRSSELPAEASNPLMSKQWHLQSESVQKAWKYMEENGLRDELESVVVAVIDTGVDYTHPNLINSMWVNSDETPGNGKDDDQNGYVDDVFGVSTIGSIFDSNGDPMDEMGHGTHVAGIIAASADSMGAVGLAYGAKIMAIKAGGNSGIFNDSDIIEGINYAIANGADVINMSFGSYSRSAAVEDALAIAYTSAVLVAAAGNESKDIIFDKAPVYPASYNYVIGVMASDASGDVAGFSNTDGIIRRNSLEYEVSAPGAQIFSTLPDGRYASWSGTSMASPYVAAMAALLRAKFNDKSVYSTRYIMGQIVGTAKIARMKLFGNFPIAADVYGALTETPEPDISYFDFYIFDDPVYSEKNNGDGIIDAGETVGLGVLIRNHWGQARNTTVKLLAAANATDATLNPHVTWKTDTVSYGDVGTFVTANNGFVYDAEDGVITGIKYPFLFTVDEDTPNDYYLTFSLVVDCETYTEDGQTKTYRFDTDTFTTQVRNGVELPRLISKDMTLTADTYYIISGSTLIEQGVTVTVEPGTQIQFWGDYSKELYEGTDVAELLVDGSFIVKGSADDPVDIFPSPSMPDMQISIRPRASTGRITLQYCNLANPHIRANVIDHCYFTQLMFDYMCELHKDMDGNWYHSYAYPEVFADRTTNSIFYELGYRYMNFDYRLSVSGELVGNLFDSCGLNFTTYDVKHFSDNVFLRNFRLVESQYGDRSYLTSEFRIGGQYRRLNPMTPLYPVKNPETGSTYFVLRAKSLVLAESFAKMLGGSVVRIGDEAEETFLLEYAKRYFAYNEDLKNYQEQASMSSLYIGFYSTGTDSNYIGEGLEENWLKLVDNTSMPMIQTSYSGSEEDSNLTTRAYISYRYLDNWILSELRDENPSNMEHWSSSGVIIELPGEITPIQISLGADALTIPSNTVNYRLIPQVFPHTDNYSLIWKSSDESVVKVDAEGKITAMGLGSATVTVTVAGTEITDEIVLVVTQYYAPTGFADDKTELSLNSYQQTVQLSPTVTPDEADPLIEYVSSDTSVVMVSAGGLVTALGSGTATVTATIPDTDFKIEYRIKVIIPPDTITASSDYILCAMNESEKKSLSYHFEPFYSTVGTVQYVSSDESVVTVDANGVLTPVSCGMATIWISFPDIEKAVFARVVVTEEEDSFFVTHGDTTDNEFTVLYTKDHTTYLFTNDQVTGDSKLPQQLPVKTLRTGKWGWSNHWMYIDTENNLYLSSRTFKSPTLIAENVADFAIGCQSSYGMFYQKMDGSMWFYDHLGRTAQNDALTNIVSFTYTSQIHSFLFLDTDGCVWVENMPGVEETQLVRFNPQRLLLEEKVIALYGEYLYTEGGNAFRIRYEEGELRLAQLPDFSAQKLKAYAGVEWSDVIDVRYYSEFEYHLLLLKDGRVVVFRWTYSDYYNNLNSLVPSYSGSYQYAVLNLEKSVAALGHGSIIFTDGSVVTFGTSYNAVLGNGKGYNTFNRNLTAPVSPWLGIVNDKLSIEFKDLTFMTSQGEESISGDLTLIPGRVTADSSFVFTLSKTVETSQLGSIYFKDALGNRVNAKASLDLFGKILTVTPEKPLSAGYDYTLTIPSGLMSDLFGNVNQSLIVSMIVEGTPAYEVPVTGIEGGKEIALEYAQSAQLDVTVLPETATMKKVYWSSSDETVATVSSQGLVTGYKNGTATVTAKTADGSFETSFTVVVSTMPERVDLITGYFQMAPGDEDKKLEITITPAYADLGTLTYISNDETVVKVDEQGNLTAVGLGSTLVGVYSSKAQKSFYALVDVVENPVRIVNIISNYSAISFFIASDYSVWYISDNSGEGENRYLPRKAAFSAKEVFGTQHYGTICYITPEDVLYYTWSPSDPNSQKVAEDVVSMATLGNGLFYLKKDGTVWYYDSNTYRATKCTALSGVSSIEKYANNDTVFFLNTQGECRYTTYSYISEGISSRSFQKVLAEEKIVDVLPRNHYMVGESGKIYQLDMSTNRLNEHGGFNNCADYIAIKDRVAQKELAWTWSGNEALILRLDDGTVWFAGSSGSVPYGLRNSIDIPDSHGYFAAPIKGLTDIVDIGTGYFLKADGTVLAYVCGDSGSRYMLGNNNYLNQNYFTPVVSWFGAQDDVSDLLLESAYAVKDEVKKPLNSSDLANQVDPASRIEITFNKQIFEVGDGVSLSDANGSLVPITVQIDKNTLILIPKQPLAQGMIYTVNVPDFSVTDVFANGSVDIEFSFATEGEYVFEIPVTGVEDTETQINLSYQEIAYLSPVIAPENATMKRLVWSSSDPTVATVNQSGEVTGLQNGVATITATTFDGGFTVSYTVTVYTPVEDFTLSEDFLYLDLDTQNSLTLGCILTPEFLDGKGLFTYFSADESIATVDENGIVIAKATGVTAIYCKCEGIDKVETCIVSVVSDLDAINIEKVFPTQEMYFAYQVEGGVWVTTNRYTVPKFVAVNDIQSVTVLSDYDSILVLHTDGKLEIVSILDSTAQPVLENVKNVVYTRYQQVFALLEDGTLKRVEPHWDYSTNPNVVNVNTFDYTVMEGVEQIATLKEENTLYMLDYNGRVWAVHAGNEDLQKYFDGEVITELEGSVGQGFMRGESGKYYPLVGSADTLQTCIRDLETIGFYSLDLEIERIVSFKRYNTIGMLILSEDGRLFYFGYEYNDNPLSQDYSGYKWTQVSGNAYFYLIDAGKEIADIGSSYIVFADGSVRMFGLYAYFGNAKYTNYEDYLYSLCTPYLIETTQDLTSLVMTDAAVGQTQINTDPELAPTETEAESVIRLKYSLPLAYTDYLALTTVKDSQGNYLKNRVTVEGLYLIVELEDALVAGETYTVTVRAGSAQDIFYNKVEYAQEITFKVKEAATVMSLAYDSSLYPSTSYSPDHSLAELQRKVKDFYEKVLQEYILEHSNNVGNAILNGYANPDATAWMTIMAEQNYEMMSSLINNFWGTTKTDLIDRIIYDVKDSFEYAEIFYDPILAKPSETAYPFVTSIKVKNSEGNIVTSVGLEEITVIVTFNRDMDQTVQPFVSYGSDYPYGDFAVEGDWIDARTWEGKTKISAVTGSGMQYFKVRGAVAADDSWLVTGNDYERFTFEIATSGAKSMSMQANSGDGFVELEWTQDDFEIMAGYNIYRSEILDGSYTRLNSSIISADKSTYVDSTAVAGVQYYYYFTVVNTDFTESEPSGIVSAASHDTTPPTIEHSAVSSAPQDAAVSIVAYVYDNMRVQSATLYYRMAGETEYSSVEMYCYTEHGGTKYTATIPAGKVTAAGVEYYIEAGDGRQTSTFYSANAPQKITTYRVYTVTVVSLTGGKITLSKVRAKAGERITVVATPNSGYAYLAGSLSYTGNGGKTEIRDGFLTMPAYDIEVSAIFLAESRYDHGDINRDGLVDSADAILLLRYDAGLVTLDQEQLLLADVNLDGSITVLDANEILRLDAGLQPLK